MGNAVTIIGVVLFSLGAFISSLNFYLSWLRYPVHRLRGGTRDEYKWVSGFPLVGSILLWFSIPCLLEHQPWPWIALVSSLFDTGGIHWFAGTMAGMWWNNRL